jgi:hypothetical protein
MYLIIITVYIRTFEPANHAAELATNKPTNKPTFELADYAA